MTTALEGLRGERHAPAALYPRERHGAPITGGWVGPRAGLDRCGKSRPHWDFFFMALVFIQLNPFTGVVLAYIIRCYIFLHSSLPFLVLRHSVYQLQLGNSLLFHNLSSQTSVSNAPDV
jgi:hypothetical protein